MAFRFCRRLDDELQFKWDSDTSGRGSSKFTDRFQRVYPLRLPRGAPSGRAEDDTRSAAGTMITIYSTTPAVSWDDGDLLRLNDPDNSDFSIRELAATTETVFAAAVGAVVSGKSLGPEPTVPCFVNITRDCLFAVTDVNGVTPASSYVDQEASLDNSSGWQIDVTGSGDVTIEDIDVNRGVFIVRFKASRIQENPFD